MLPFVVPRLTTDLPVRVFPGVWKSLFFKIPFSGWISVPTSFVSLFIFYIFSYLLLKTLGCLSGCLMSSASIQKLFCGICLAFICSFDEFLGEKVVSPSYSSVILWLLHPPAPTFPWFSRTDRPLTELWAGVYISVLANTREILCFIKLSCHSVCSCPVFSIQ